MNYNTDIQGHQQSGGWRYPYTKQSSSDMFYKPRAHDAQRLLELANGKAAPQGLLDQAVQKPALTAQGLLSGAGGESGGGGDSQTQASSRAPGHEASGAWGMNKYGVDVNFSPKGAAKGFAAMGPLGGLLGGVQLSKDPLGQFAYDALVAQENRDIAASQSSSDVAGGGGWSSLSPDVQASVAVADDPIGAFADAIGMGGGGEYGGTSGGVDGMGDAASAGVDGGGFAHGGHVTMGLLGGPNPQGKDDGYAALDAGEFVLKSDMVKKHGLQALQALNAGKAKIIMNRGG